MPRSRFVIAVGLSVAMASSLVACGTDGSIVTNGTLSVAVCTNCNSGGAVLYYGRFVVVGDGCLGLEEVLLDDVAEGSEPETFVVALPVGSAITPDGVVSVPGVGEIPLGAVFTYDISGWAWDPATESEPSRDISFPAGCPSDMETRAILPLGLPLTS